MAGKKRFKIDVPNGVVSVSKNKDGVVTANLKWDSNFSQNREQSFSKKQAFIDQECIRRMTPETPVRSGVLVKSATLGTTIGSGEIIQNTPYARRQYYEHKTKSYWFERMKNRHKDSILKGAQKIE